MPWHTITYDHNCCRRVGNVHYNIYLRQRAQAMTHWRAGQTQQALEANRVAMRAQSRARAWWNASWAGGCSHTYWRR